MDTISHIDWSFAICVGLVYFFMLRARTWRKRYYIERVKHQQCHTVFESLLKENGQEGLLMILNPERDAYTRRQ